MRLELEESGNDNGNDDHDADEQMLSNVTK